MKILKIILILLASSICLSQEELRLSREEIKDLHSNLMQSGNELYILNDGYATVFYFENDICTIIMLLILDDWNVVNKFINEFNEKYNIISHKKWTGCINNMSVKVELFVNQNTIYFSISENFL